MKDIPLDKAIQIYVTFVVSTTFAIVLVMVLFKAIPAENRDAAFQLLGTLATLMTAIIMFYYGSSKGGRENREQLNQIQDRNQKIIEELQSKIASMDNNNP